VPSEIDHFDYRLSSELIAQHPAEPRDAARLLDATDLHNPRHRAVSDLAELITPGDVVVLNNTRVRRARLRLRKQTGGAAEVLLVTPTGDPSIWTALVKPARRLLPGTVLLDGDVPIIEIVGVLESGERLVRVLNRDRTEKIGVLPLPPYIHAPPEDPDRYQTVFADRTGSVAAPTAGLHFTPELLEKCRAAGARIVTIDLEVGLGTFAPITAHRLDDHVMHSETYSISETAWAEIGSARRVVAVGTTVVRTLETVAITGRLEGETDIFIRPGFQWQTVDVLLTNFHMPRSTLLVLVEAFIGKSWRQLYRDALTQGYSVGSFGDAMLLSRLPTKAAG
jgi:S-adenosylmethionine:tRNA ribosyltransferase-isomerase